MHILNLVLLYSLPNAFKHLSAFLQALCLALALFSRFVPCTDTHVPDQLCKQKQIKKEEPRSQVGLVLLSLQKCIEI